MTATAPRGRLRGDPGKRGDGRDRFATRARARRRRLWLTLAAAVVAVAVVAGGAWVVLRTSVLGVRTVTVVGVHRLTAAQVKAAAGVPLGHPLATLDVGGIQRRVAALAPVASVAVSREWPHGVRIAVRERTPFAEIRTPHGMELLDRSGVVFATVPAGAVRLPTVSVSSPGPRDPATRAALDVLAALPPSIRHRVRLVSAPGPSSVQLSLTGGDTVVWGDASQSARKAEVLAALLKRPGHIYDVSTPDIVTVR